MIILLILILILCGGGWGYGYRSGGLTLGNPIGIILIIVVLAVLFGGIGPHLGFYHW